MVALGVSWGLTMLISEGYRALCEKMHCDNKDWGSLAIDPWLAQSLAAYRATEILDYGCGKGQLARVLKNIPVRSYDPAVPEFSAPPEPADTVVCRTVLEHIEPECLEAVLDDLKRCTMRVVLLKITLVPSGLTLADGRNAHLIVKPANWWMEHLLRRWSLLAAQRTIQGLRFAGVDHDGLL